MNDLAASLRASEALLPLMKTKTTMELVSIELTHRPRGGDFHQFCAAKWTLNDRGFQCAACSISAHRHGKDAVFRCSPCTDCKGKNIIPANEIPVIVPTENP
jgi:hypothetical protein